MTQEEKAKRYDEALEIARKNYVTAQDLHEGSQIDVECFKNTLESIFYELKESGYERIKTAILNHLKKMWGNSQDDVCGVHVEDAIEWLENVGKDKEINNFDVLPGFYKCVHRMFDGTPESKLLFEVGNIYKCLSKHSRAEFEVSYGHSVYLEDPVVCKHFIPFEKKYEPKFKVGDWAVSNLDRKARQISEVHFDEYNSYYVVNGISVNLEEYDRLHHSWTINDAKVGDVLFHSDSASNGIFIFKEILQRGTIQKVICYCDYDSEDGFCLGENHTCCWTDSKILHPATKEQSDLLFTKMKESGYEWDAEKKELKKGRSKMTREEEIKKQADIYTYIYR